MRGKGKPNFVQAEDGRSPAEPTAEAGAGDEAAPDEGGAEEAGGGPPRRARPPAPAAAAPCCLLGSNVLLLPGGPGRQTRLHSFD